MKLTVFTPAYNRADKLPRVFESLQKQHCTDFEWLIVDDGSSDETRSVAERFQRSGCAFPIRYQYQENGGKASAYNAGLESARGELFFCLDSDDFLAEDAVSQILEASALLREQEFFAAYKQDEQGRLLSSEFPANVSCTTLSDLSQKYGCTGEFSLIFPTDLARRFPFPQFEGEKFVTESVIYDQIGAVSQVRLLPKVITVCEYQPDGLTANISRIMKRNPAGYCLYFMQRIDLQPSWKSRFLIAGKYRCFCLFAGKKKTPYHGKHPLCAALAAPLGLLFWVYYKLLRGF